MLERSRPPASQRQSSPHSWRSCSCAAGWRRGGPPEAPERAGLMTDDQTLESLRVMTNVASSWPARARRSRQLRDVRRSAAPRARPSSPASTPTTTACSATRRRSAATAARHAIPAALAPAAGYRTIHVGKYLNGYGRDTPAHRGAAGLERVVRVDRPIDLPLLGLHAQRERAAQDLRHRPQPGLLQHRLLLAARRGPDRAERAEPAALLPLGRLPRPARRRPARARRSTRRSTRPPSRPATATASPARRCRHRPPTTRPTCRTSRRTSAPCRAVGPARGRADPGELPAAARVAAGGGRGHRPHPRRAAGAGELDDTLVVFTSDNGFFHGEHRVQAGKVLVYEPSIRVPLILRGPGVPRRATRPARDERRPRAHDPRRRRGPARADPGRALALRSAGRSGREWGRDLLIEGGGVPGRGDFDALRTYRYLYAEYSTGERELYDLDRDPYELQSRHADPAYRVRPRAAGPPTRRVEELRRCEAAGPPQRAAARARLHRPRRPAAGSSRWTSAATRPRARPPRARSAPLAAGRELRARVRHARRAGRDARPPVAARLPLGRQGPEHAVGVVVGEAALGVERRRTDWKRSQSG